MSHLMRPLVVEVGFERGKNSVQQGLSDSLPAPPPRKSLYESFSHCSQRL
jgi:hypothetical protein